MAEPIRPDFRGAAADSAAAEAAAWLGRHDRGLAPGEAAAFAAWRSASPAHAAEFDRIAHAWDAAGAVAAADSSLAALAQTLDDVTRAQASRRRVRRQRVVWGAGLAAAAAVAVMFFSGGNDGRIAPAQPGATIAASVPGVAIVPSAARRVDLPDGSVAEVRGDSEVRAVFTDGERRVRLVRGEAHFAVRKDAARPFVVEAAGLAVRAVGTAFNVKLGTGEVEVLVTEGTISLHEAAGAAPVAPGTAPLLVAGQRAVVDVDAAGTVSLARLAVGQVVPSEMETSLAWQGVRLVLNRATLADAVLEFNRHGGGRLVIADEALSGRRISGTIRADNAEAFVRLLEQAAEVRVGRRADGTVELHEAR